MQPLVKQHLESIRKTMLEHVIPNVAGNAFVAEQVGLIAASLAMLMEVQPYEDDYLRAELDDLRRSLDILGDAVPATPLRERDSLQAEVMALKARQTARLEALAAANEGMVPKDVLSRLLPLLQRQEARELSWTRLTGFHPAAASLPEIREVLATQCSGE
jgi:hypothetical protein